MPLVRAIARDAIKNNGRFSAHGPRRRQEQAVPDEHEDRGSPRAPRPRRRADAIRDQGESTESCRSSPRGTFRAARSCKGAGVTLALPLLEAMVPAAPRSRRPPPASRKSRFVGVFFPHGMAPGYWEPAGRGRAAGQAAVHPGVARRSVKDQTVVSERSLVEVGGAARGNDRVRSLGGRRVSSPASSRARPPGRTPPSAAPRSISRSRRRSARRRCCRRCSSRSKIRTRARATAARATAARTRTRSRGSSCRRRRTRTVPRTSPLPMELNPQVVFERLFGSGSTPEVRAQRMKQSRSILDSLIKELGDAAQAARRRRTSRR